MYKLSMIMASHFLKYDLKLVVISRIKSRKQPLFRTIIFNNRLVYLLFLSFFLLLFLPNLPIQKHPLHYYKIEKQIQTIRIPLQKISPHIIINFPLFLILMIHLINSFHSFRFLIFNNFPFQSIVFFIPKPAKNKFKQRKN